LNVWIARMDIILTPQGDLFGNDGALQFDEMYL
jgi:hypothetical protein